MADATYNPQPFVSNPYSSFDPSQYKDPYSLFSGKALPWPSQYAGTPTDAYGNPIQSYVDANTQAQAQYQQQLAAYQQQQAAAAQPAASGTSGTSGTPGTTLNSYPAAAGQQGQPWNYYSNPTGATPGQPYSSPSAVPQSAIGPDQTAFSVYASQPDVQYRNIVAQMPNPEAQQSGGGYQHTVGGPGGDYNAIGAMAAYQNMNQIAALNQQQQAPAAAPTAPTPPDMSAAYLSALANPGPLKPVGANVPQSATTTQPDSGVLQNFLANWQPQGGSGPGAGFTQAFSKALRGK